MSRPTLALICSLAVLPGFANAIDVTIVNHSFEQPVIGAGTFSTNSPPTGWVGFGSLNFSNRTIGVLNPSTTTLYPGGAPDGSNVGVVFLMDNAGNQSFFANSPAGLEQTLSATLQPSSQYILTVNVGNIANDPTLPHNQFQFAGFPGYRIELLAGGSVIATDNNSLLPGEGVFFTSILQFTSSSNVTPGQALGIRLINLNSSVGLEVNFDNVRLAFVPVPEANAVILCAMAALPALAFRRRGR